MKRVARVQHARALAVISVILFHIEPQRYPFGYLGVDVFFVISGFVLFESYKGILTKQLSVKKFLYSRSIRLLPALLNTLAFSLLFFLLFMPPDLHQILINQAVFSIFGIGNLGAIIFSPDYFFENENPLIHTWSLSAELQLYLIFLFICLAVRGISVSLQLRTKYLLALSGILGTGLAITTLIFFPVDSVENESLLFYSPFLRLLEFSLGALAAQLSRKSNTIDIIIDSRRTKFLNFTYYATGLLLTCILLFNYIFSITISLLYVLVCLLTAINLSIGKCVANKDSSVSKLISRIGDISYSLYLLHLPIVFVVDFYFLDNTFLVKAAAIMTFSLILSEIQYRLIENSYRTKLKNVRASDLDLFLRIRIGLVVSMLSVLMPLMFFGSRHAYYGLDKNAQVPSMDTSLAETCSGVELKKPLCRWSGPSTSTKKVVLLGDSHAWMLHRGVKEAAELSDFEFIPWYQPGCPFILPKAGSDLDIECKENNLIRYNYLLRGDVEVVILSQSWTGSSKFSEMSESLIRLKSLSKKVIVIGQTPELPEDIYAPNPLTWAPNKLQSFYLESEVNSIFREFNFKVAMLAVKEGFEYVDSFAILCPQARCFTTNPDGEFVYFDRGHLSEAGALLYVQKLTEVLEKFG